jgi:hypothetical protein
VVQSETIESGGETLGPDGFGTGTEPPGSTVGLAGGMGNVVDGVLGRDGRVVEEVDAGAPPLPQAQAVTATATRTRTTLCPLTSRPGVTL